MDETPATRASLIVKLRDPADTDAWREFVTLYEPLVYRLARRKGLQDADARDLCQEVFRTVAQAIEELLEAQPADDPSATAVFEAEYRRRLFQWAADEVRGEFAPTTWHAFWQTAVEDRRPSDVAAELGLSVGAVYIARSRVLARLRHRIEQRGDEASAILSEADHATPVE
jgi:RNA polymerase sigma-70 factor (ECF subfamily)